ncbi:hypothetical protein SLS58_010603 [Diplodia intermedia]|uniref:EF-hand domain-containing protein n=1 Tax=Diplodia intermedia TaxID=856260 RepID=A0ABR3T529_9PEZI
MRESFSVLDRDNKGTISAPDVQDALSQVGLDNGPASITPYFEGQSQSLNLSAYLNMMASLLAPLSRERELLSAFEAFDDQDDGQIDVAELRDALMNTAPEPGQERLTELEIERVVEGFRGRRALGKKGKGGLGRGDVFRYKEFVGSMEVDSPTPSTDGNAPTCSPVTANTQANHGDIPKAIMNNEPQKPPVPAWLTDPAGRAVITLIPSVDNHKRNDPASHYHRKTVAILNELGQFKASHPAVARRQQQQVDDLLQAQSTGPPSDLARDACTTGDSSHAQKAQGNPQGSGRGDVNASIPQNEQPAPSDNATNLAQTTQTPRQSQQSKTIYVVLTQYQPLVEYGGSEFEFGIQDQHSKINGFSTVNHYTKAFRLLGDAKTYALDLFTQRITLDYRYVMQKAWDDLSLEEIRAYGVTEDGPSPHIRGFRMSSTSEPYYWQVRFGCDEEFCRISVLPVKSDDPKLKDLPFVEAGQPHGRIPTSLEPPKRPAKTPVDAEMAEDATEATSNMEKSDPAESTASTSTTLTETSLPSEG